MSKKRAAIGWLALIGLLAFSVGPVCGSASDVDAEACCARHSHSDSESDWAGMQPSGHQPSPEEFCQDGHLFYPAAKLEAKAQIVAGADVGNPRQVLDPAAGELPPYTISFLAPLEDLRPPGVPLHELTATYRL
ncbi:MAG: hypothetical protein L0212_04675 [Acidobacteria bacterium]|nr:hypothetical protein [Acidobacteriota bacterium]